MSISSASDPRQEEPEFEASAGYTGRYCLRRGQEREGEEREHYNTV